MRKPALGFCALLLGAVLPGCGTLIGRTRADYIGAMNFVGGLLSLPFDMVIDVVLLPADLIGWLFGLEKDFSRC